MGHKLSQWEDRVRHRLGDLGVIQAVETTRIPMAIEVALSILSNDRPREISESFSGDGTTYDFTLTGTGDDAWVDRWSRLVEIEYPVGERPRSLLELRRAEVLRGTATVRLNLDTPASGTDNLKLTYTVRYPHPTATAADDDVPDAWFEAVTGLAASDLCRSKAIEFARRQSSSIAGMDIGYDAQPLFQAAKALRALYDEVVLGIPAGGEDGGRSEAAVAVGDQDIFPNALFHRRVSSTS